MPDREDPTFRMPGSQPLTAQRYENLDPMVKGLLEYAAGRIGRPVESFFAQAQPQPQQQLPVGQLSQFLQGVQQPAQQAAQPGNYGVLGQYMNQMQQPQQPFQGFNSPWSNGLHRLSRNW